MESIPPCMPTPQAVRSARAVDCLAIDQRRPAPKSSTERVLGLVRFRKHHRPCGQPAVGGVRREQTRGGSKSLLRKQSLVQRKPTKNKSILQNITCDVK